MGKMKRIRQKLHNASKRNKDKESTETANCEMMDSDAMPPPPVDPTALGSRGYDLFKDIKIGSLELVRQKLPDFDARSTVTSKTFKGMNITKKEKRRLRREAFLAKIEHIQTADKKTKERKKKNQTVVVGNLDPMLEALPTLELLMKSSPKESKSEVSDKNRSTQPERIRKAKMLKDISLFQQVLKHPLFVEDERRTITEHLKISMEKETT